MSADAAIARGFSHHRPEALAAAYDRYGKLLYTTAYRVLNNASDAQDCVHDALVRVWEKTGAYTPARGALAPFLVVCVRNLAIARVRRMARRAQIDKSLVRDEIQFLDVPDPVELRALQIAISTLPPEVWEPLRLAYLEHLTHVEIAERLNIPLGTAKGRISNGLRKLRAALGHHSPTEHNVT